MKEELAGIPVVAKFATTATDGKTYQMEYYNLEMITSIGYRVKSPRGIQFRVWANKILKDYLLRGYSINQRLMQLEDRIDRRLSEYDRHLLQLDEKVEHNTQYPGVTLHPYPKAHDRFLIIDEKVYHIGASLKDLGKKLFAFSKMDVMTGSELVARLEPECE